MSAPVTAQDFSEIRWRGHWIWVEPSVPGGMMPAMGSEGRRPEAHGLFRRTFALERVPARAPARITADSRYLLFVNGQEAYRGPVRSQPRRLHYDLLDLAPHLVSGQNTIAILVVYYGGPRSFWIPAAPNMTLGRSGVLVVEADLGGALVGPGATTLVGPSESTTLVGPSAGTSAGPGPAASVGLGATTLAGPGTSTSVGAQAGWLVTDASWKALKSDAWSDDWRSTGEGLGMISEGVPLEVFDARRFPYGWEQPGFDDHGWGYAHLIPAVHIGGFARTQPPTDPYGPLYPRPIARLGGKLRTPASLRAERLAGQISPDVSDPVRRLEAALGLPISGPLRGSTLPLTLGVPLGDSVRVVVDMGVIVMGQVRFEVRAAAGTVFDFSYTEEPLVRAAGMIGMHAGTRYTARGDNDRFQLYDALGFRYAYVLVHGTAGEVTLKSFAVQEDIYPWQPGASFSCSDEALNRIFQAGIRTVQLNSRDAFTDCPTREQRAWVGDSVVHQMVHLATNLDWRLAWHYLTLGNSPRSDGILPMSVVGEIESSGGYTIPDWSLHWVHGVYNLYRFTGDRDAVKAFMPTVERILRWYAPFQTAGGPLKDVVEWDLVDWSGVSVKDTSAILTALWARGLREYAELAGWLEENASKRWAEGLYARARAGFEVFWDERRGSYVDHIVDGIRQPEMSQLAGALAVASGMAPGDRWGRIIQAITDPGSLVVRSWTDAAGEYQMQKMLKQFQGIYEIDWDAQRQVVLAEPFMSYVVHDAVALAGLADRLPQLYRRWSEFLVDGYDTIGECWGWGTHVHGWSCTPTRDMVFYTLGVTPAEPGYTKARVAPRLGDLAWAEGDVPTPHGLIHVRAERGRVNVDSPVPVIVDLPGQAPRTLPAGRHEVAPI